MHVPTIINCQLSIAGPQPTETDITFYITIRRKTLFYTVNLILPTVNKYNIYNIIYILINTFHHIMQVLISFLCVLVFYLPAEVSIIIISFVRSSTVYSSLIHYIPGGQAPNVSEFTANIIPVTRVKQDQLHSQCGSVRTSYLYSNTLKTPLKHPSTPIKIISFFAQKMDGKK